MPDQEIALSRASLLLRVWLGANMLLVHGIPKAMNAEAFVNKVDSWMPRFPTINWVGMLGGGPLDGLAHKLPQVPSLGWAAILAETVGSVCLIFGFATRWAAASLFITMLVAGLGAHAGDSWKEREFVFTYCVMALSLMFLGGGQFSYDGRRLS